MGEQISKNFKKGEPIKTVNELMGLARNRKAVYLHTLKLRPAAFMINLPLSYVFNQIEAGRIYKTEKIEKEQ